MALCVGINRFAHLPQMNWLHGCVNDADDMGRGLVELFDFESGEIVSLTDERATKTRVVDELGAMVERAGSGAVSHLVFSYSSHGTQLPDTSGDEPDRLDEAFAAYDIAADGDQWDPATVLVDDELRTLFAQVPGEVLLEVYLDTCHSGSGLRAFDVLPGRTPKYIPPPTPEGLDLVLERSSRVLDRGRSRRPANQVLFAACRSDQTASDATFDRRPNGAFTYVLLQAMRASPGLSRAQLLTQLRKALKAGRYDQVPQLETGKKNREMPPGRR